MQTFPTALVVEGGAMRGIFSSGVLDVFLERDFCPFTFAIGASAGACNLASFLAGQHDRNRRCYMDYMARPEFLSAGRFLRGGHWLDLDWLWESFERDHPIDVGAIFANRVRLVVAATAVDSGAPVFLDPDRESLMTALKGSSAIPILYRSFVHYGEHPIVDGGVTAPIPAEEAYRRGAKRIVVIRSRPAEFVKRAGVGTQLGAWALRRYPALADAFRRAPGVYARSVSFLENPPSDCQVLHIAPPTKLRTGRTTRDRQALAHDYALGRQIGERAIATWTRDVADMGEQAKEKALDTP
jgi:predicted patatin/cPLA2 family phospholipase